jgi:acetoin utilization protein AcuB
MRFGHPEANDSAQRWGQSFAVREWMARDPVVVRDDVSITVAVDLLRARRIRHLPVVDDAGRLAGMVSERDLRQVIFEPWIPDILRNGSLLTVRDVMTWVVSVPEDYDLRAAVRLMRQRKIGALPVVTDGRVVGIVTETDALPGVEAAIEERAESNEGVVD